MLNILVNQLVPASLYALVSIGFVVVYRSTRVLNFAQGQLVLLGGYGAYTISQFFSGGKLLTIVVAFVAAFAFGALLYYVILRPLLGSGVLILVMLTIALATVLAAVAQIGWGAQPLFLKFDLPKSTVSLPFSVRVSWLSLIIIAVAVVVLGGFGAFLRWTRYGRWTRAAAENPMLASYRGVNVIAISAATWGFAMITATIAGMAYSLENGIDPNSANVLGFAAFPAVLVGGLDSVGGALVGSVILAEVQGIASTYLGAEWSNPVGYLLLLAFLVVRPYGLFGTKDIVRV